MSIERGVEINEVPELEQLREVTSTLMTTALREPDNYSGFTVTTFAERDYAKVDFTRVLHAKTQSAFETFTITREGVDQTIIFQTQRPTLEDEGLGGVIRVTKEYPLGYGRPTTFKEEQGRDNGDGTLSNMSVLAKTEGKPLDSGEPEQLNEIESLTKAMRFIRGEYNEGQPRTRLGWLRWLLSNPS
jgi:hypothetical protein